MKASLPDAMVLGDVEQLRALADPLRLEILDVMGQHPIRSWTAKELAQRIGGSQTRLYRHLALLEKRALIRVASTRVVSGITERRYEVTAMNYRLDRSMVMGDAGEAAVNQVLDVVFERARAEIVAGVRAGLIDVDPTKGPTRLVMTTSRGRLGPDTVLRVTALLDELDALASSDDPDGKRYGLVAGFYPVLGDERSEH
ncbi:MAG TPA: helix-turn-helix domain-containing protein [Candidatus Limnocylindria bacterium]